MVHHRLQAPLAQGLEFGGGEDPLEQYHRLVDAGLAQGQGLVEAGHAEGIGAVEGTGDFDDAVAVAVGLDHTQLAGTGGDAAGAFEIGAQGGQADHGPRVTGHA